MIIRLIPIFLLLFFVSCIQNLSKCPSDVLSLKSECETDVKKKDQDKLLLILGALSATPATGTGTGTTTGTGTGSTSTGEYTEVSGIVSSHNTYRASEGVSLPDVSWDSTVATYAKSKVEYLANQNNCTMSHTAGPSNPGYGENLYWRSAAGAKADDVVKAWYSEKQYYTYSSNTCQSGQVCGHYTQVVWKTSVKIGCYAAKCPSGAEIWGCNYSPPGNYVGQKPY
ncbi:MAG: hypothetical protein H7A25_17075 [Leptospiraceae bacterium]|nr:hypothetical protein [Leptospiraceae bacterium]MCP5501618.1 hypothetical protein [Leptospiraceae bacterium]